MLLAFLLVAIFAFFWIKFFRYELKLFFRIKGSLLISAIYIVQFIIFHIIFVNERFRYNNINSIIISRILSIIFTNLLTYFQISLYKARLLSPELLLIMTIIDIIIIVVITTITKKIYYNFVKKQSVLIIHEEYKPNLKKIIKEFNDNPEVYEFKDSINISELTIETLHDYDLIFLYDLKSSNRNYIIKYCYRNSIDVIVTEKISDILMNGFRNINIYKLSAIKINNETISTIEAIVKRTMDILISLIALILLSPIIIIIAIAIKIEDGGDILFVQKRYTKNKKIFKIYKFRSMKMEYNSANHSKVTLKNDKRITRVGKAIRQIRFDEIPQLFNILIGDMSLVGPRPECIENHDKYCKSISEFDLKLKVKAGLTGYSQIYGKHNSTPYEKIRLDLIYIQNYSLLLDLKLLFLTFKIVFIHKSSEGFDSHN